MAINEMISYDIVKIKNKRIILTNISLFIVLWLINLLFVYKYGYRITPYYWILCIIYSVIIIPFSLLIFKIHRISLSSPKYNLVYFSVIAILSLLLYLLMCNFDPKEMRVGRYNALYDWITRLLNKDFPYNSPTNPSGLPFLFILAIPFYLIGDLGLIQIFSFLIFAVILHIKHNENITNNLFCILLLIFSPIFLYEIVVRSELFSNIIIVILYITLFEIFSKKFLQNQSKKKYFFLLSFGIIGGFLLSTRTIVLLIYIIFFGYFFRSRIIEGILFFVSMFIGFFITIFPFLLWNRDYFIVYGPFSIQLSYIPTWLLILSIVIAIFFAFKVQSILGIYISISFILFSIVCVRFILTIFNCGWYNTVIESSFDISYFSFAVPFLLMSLNFYSKEQ